MQDLTPRGRSSLKVAKGVWQCRGTVRGVSRRARRRELGEDRVYGQKGWRRLEAGGGAMATPAVLLGALDDGRLDGVEHDVAADREQVRVAFDQDGAVAGLEEVAAAAVPAVEALGVDAVEVAHAEREVPERRLQEQVVVRFHEAVGVAKPAVASDGVGERGKQRDPVLIVTDDASSFVSARDHVDDCARRTDAKRSAHATSVGPSDPRRQRPRNDCHALDANLAANGVWQCKT